MVGNVDDVLLVVHDFPPFQQLGAHLEHLAVEAEVGEAAAVVLLEVVLEVLLQGFVVELGSASSPFQLLQLKLQSLVVSVDFLHLFI
jgi:hypothetical protein